MYHVYTEKNHSEFSRALVIETPDYDLALEKAQGIKLYNRTDRRKYEQLRRTVNTGCCRK